MEQSKYLFNAACYCRLSKDDENDGTSVSIESQIQILTDFCRENNLKIFDFYCDDGFTGTNFDRPSYKRMMSDIDKNLINTIVVKDIISKSASILRRFFPKKAFVLSLSAMMLIPKRIIWTWIYCFR